MNLISYYLKKYWLVFSCLIVLPGIAQILYSRYGFNQVSDYGFILAQSRRLLNGDVPHLDFISIRPVGSAFLHLPVVWLGGDFTFYLSKAVVWFQFATIAYLWTQILDQSFKLKLSDWKKLITIFAGFIFGAHNFLLTPWHTLDALFLISIGAYLLSFKSHSNWRIIAYFLMGFAYLCKQNFLPVVFLAIVFEGDCKQWRYWFAAVAPGVLYSLYILLSGGVSDALAQLTAQSDFFYSGFTVYSLSLKFFYGLAYGAIGTTIIMLIESAAVKRKYSYLNYIIFLGFFSLIFWILRTDLFNGNTIISGAFLALGLLLGFAIGQLANGKSWLEQKMIIFILLISWLASISMGYLTPALGLGILVIAIIMFFFKVSTTIKLQSLESLAVIIIIIWVIFDLLAFNFTRFNHIYADVPAKELTQPLSDVFPGTRGLRTFQANRKVLLDFNNIRQKYSGKEFAILPDYAAYWVKSPYQNPISIDWALDQEMYDYGSARIHNDLASFTAGGGIIILEKFNEEPPYRSIMAYVSQNYSLLEETPNFKIFQAKDQK